MSTPSSAAPVALPAPAHTAPGLSLFVKSVLGIDLAICALLVPFAVLGTLAFLRGETGGDTREMAMLRIVLQFAGIGLGIAADVLLLRRQAFGFWLGCWALAVACVGMVLSVPVLQRTLEGLDDASRITVLVGFMVTLGGRFLFNVIYAFALQRAWRALQGAPQVQAGGTP